MQFDLSLPQDGLFFKSYDDDFIEINGQKFHQAFHVNFSSVTQLDSLTFDDVSATTFAQAIMEKPELIIIGCGPLQKFLHPKIHAYLAEHKIGLEVMVTPAALRTFNVLKGEGRKVWAWVFF
ncbi:Mth938-like domain-containing protein [Neisseria sp. Ec49-e6-T10]|uniref:Mth938-like domain-containing protein n=1 Tax=Neisseria sp. Ec49-e6-T10 TaxID=3140744 RepID=UPI003EBB9AFB